MRVTDRPVIASCLLGSRLRATGVSGVVAGGERLGGNGRPTQAPAVAAAAQAHAYASTCAANGAGEGRQKKQHLTMWAFRGLEPRRDPA
jgi:hypothetical protein